MKTLPITELPNLREQLLQQAHDLLDTCDTIVKIARQVKEQEAEEPEGWHDWKTDKPIEGERVVVDTGKSQTYFLTYFEAERNMDIKRWFRLPDGL